MGELVVQKDRELVELLHKQNQLGELEKPFERDIMLFDTVVAGSSHVEGIRGILSLLHVDDRLEFVREPENPFDENAIAVMTENDEKIGYVPRADNVVFSRLMDAGKQLYGKVTSMTNRTNWVRVEMRIYLHE